MNFLTVHSASIKTGFPSTNKNNQSAERNYQNEKHSGK